MNKYKYILTFVAILFSFSVLSQTKKQNDVAGAVIKLIKAMEDGDLNVLRDIAAPQLSYGHSGGKVETKEEFIQPFATGASDFVRIKISEQTIDVINKTAIVRHTLEGDTNDNNKPGHVKLKVMTVWQKIKGQWKLLARQAVKAPAN